MNDPIDPEIPPIPSGLTDFDGALGYKKEGKNARTAFEDFLDMVDGGREDGEKRAIGTAILEILSNLLPHDATHSLLEIGPGTGIVTKFYAHLFRAGITCIEPANEYCAMLNATFPSAQIINNTFQDYASDPNLDGSGYDVIAISHAFQYIPEPLAHLQRMLDLRNPEGKLVITMSDMSEMPSQYTKFIAKFQSFGHKEPEFNVQDARRYLTNAGYHFDQYDIESDFVCPTEDDFFKVLKIIMNIDDSKLTESQRNEIREYLVPFHTERGIVLRVGHTILVV